MKCIAPWFELHLHYSARVTCCAFFSGRTDQIQGDQVDPEMFWNSPAMQELRKGVVSGNSAGCRNCTFLQYPNCGSFPDFNVTPTHITPLQRSNWEEAYASYLRGDHVLKSFPLRYCIVFGPECNLSCIMCNQHPDRSDRADHFHFHNLPGWSDYLKSAYEVFVIGGEPFAIPEAVNFIRSFAGSPGLKEVTLNIATNSTLVHHHLEILEKIPRLNFWISIDSFGKTYEHIRRGGKWHVVEENISSLCSIRRQKRPEWNITTANMVMKSTIPTLGEFIDWSIDMDVMPLFQNFIYTPGLEEVFETENVFARPGLLHSVRDWEGIMSSAIEKLRRRGWMDSASILIRMKKELHDSLDQYESNRREAESGSYGATLFDKHGADLVAILEKNRYDRGLYDNLVEMKGQELIFTPATPKDHLATPYIQVHDSPGKTGTWLRITFGFGDIKPDTNCVIHIQDERCELISDPITFLSPSLPSSGPGELVGYHKISNRSIRLLIQSSDCRPTRLPSAIKIQKEQV